MILSVASRCPVHDIHLGFGELFAFVNAGDKIPVLLRVQFSQAFFKDFLEVREVAHDPPDYVSWFHSFHAFLR